MREEDVWAHAPNRRPRTERIEREILTGSYIERPINQPAQVPIVQNKDPLYQYFWIPTGANNPNGHAFKKSLDDWMELGYEPAKAIEHPELSYCKPSAREQLNIIASELGIPENRVRQFRGERQFIYWMDCILMKIQRDILITRTSEEQRSKEKMFYAESTPEGFNSETRLHNMKMTKEQMRPLDQAMRIH